MKKFGVIGLILIMSLSILVGCKGNSGDKVKGKDLSEVEISERIIESKNDDNKEKKAVADTEVGKYYASKLDVLKRFCSKYGKGVTLKYSDDEYLYDQIAVTGFDNKGKLEHLKLKNVESCLYINEEENNKVELHIRLYFWVDSDKKDDLASYDFSTSELKELRDHFIEGEEGLTHLNDYMNKYYNEKGVFGRSLRVDDSGVEEYSNYHSGKQELVYGILITEDNLQYAVK